LRTRRLRGKEASEAGDPQLSRRLPKPARPADLRGAAVRAASRHKRRAVTSSVTIERRGTLAVVPAPAVTASGG